MDLPTETTLVQWLRDVFPDMLWLCALVDEHGSQGMRTACNLVDQITSELKEAGLADGVCDGSLTGFEQMSPAAREVTLRVLQQEQHANALSESFCNALSMFPEAPGAWLVHPWRARGHRVDPEAAQNWLAALIVKCEHGQAAVPTRAKFLVVRNLSAAGLIGLGPRAVAAFEGFDRYPDSLADDELNAVESTIRATFGFVSGLGSDEGERHSWARLFWRSNWKLFACIHPEGNARSLPDTDAVRQAGADIRAWLHERDDRFLRIAKITDPDLYDPDRFEVLTGLVAKVLNDLRAASLSPVNWSVERGAGLIRGVVEALIVFRWLVHRNELGMYRRFKDYGRGRLKLLKLHTENYVAQLAVDVPDGMQEYLNHLALLVNQDVGEEFQTVSLDATFSGRSLRDMASDVGMENDYRLLFAPASSSMHAEWSTLDRNNLSRCRSPLHRWHRIAVQTPGVTMGVGAINLTLPLVEALLDEYDSVMHSATSSDNGTAVKTPT